MLLLSSIRTGFVPTFRVKSSNPLLEKKISFLSILYGMLGLPRNPVAAPTLIARVWSMITGKLRLDSFLLWSTRECCSEKCLVK
jgi:hypothetical protein